MCENGGSCVEINNDYKCNCRVGLTGERCETGTLFNTYDAHGISFLIHMLSLA